ncbi:DEAD/DEAH box helicase [Austwickia chelonae]|uniref:DEAD/DEAH box helicase n=1 Tax=Austwickia chelonae TaxID=100225 RepID=UPI000E22C1D5|nr:DEAD/DEAH box helicase [Austwickia chelonae]
MTDAGGQDGRPSDLLELLLTSAPERIRHLRHRPAQPGVHAELPDWVAPPLVEALGRQGIHALWRHQREAAELLHHGDHVVIATGTASGKSLSYLLPALTAVSQGVRTLNGRGATALYLAPTKALTADQEARVAALELPGVRAATFDGDTPAEERRRIRAQANYLLTNPDMLHHTLLPRHQEWAPFLRALNYVVIDECHMYRGVFGAHAAAVLRRLRRLCHHYGAHPTFALSSATSADPASQATALCGLPVTAITRDDSAQGTRHILFWEPPLTQSTEGTPKHRSALAESARLLAAAVDTGVQAVVFTRSRAGTEILAAQTRQLLALIGERRAAAEEGTGAGIAAYRGGYLPEERRQLEHGLRDGSIRGVAATTALELGVDISGLDAVIVAGWPGTRASWWQQVGRAGRSGADAVAIFVADDDPLDTYLLHHPEAVLGEPVEATVLDPDNPHVLGRHLLAAAAESPLTSKDSGYFGAGLFPLVDALTDHGSLRRRPHGWCWIGRSRPTDQFSLRGASQVVHITDRDTGRVIGTVDAARADATVHTGAVHLHQGQTFVVTQLDLDTGIALVVPGDPGWVTQARTRSAFDIRTLTEERRAGAVTVTTGAVAVRQQVVSFQRRTATGDVLGEHPLDLPARTLDTRGVWWTITPELLASAGIDPARTAGAAHAAEHAAIGLLPLIATADRWDIGGVSAAWHPDTGLPTVLVHDGHPGGAGFADRGYRRIETWLTATRQAVAECPCTRGCPSCVHSPKCGNGNRPLDKAGAILLLDLVLHALAGSPPPPVGSA